MFDKKKSEFGCQTIVLYNMLGQNYFEGFAYQLTKRKSIDIDNILTNKSSDTSFDILKPESIEKKDTEEEIDPFDTAIADKVVPGKAEIKVLESELLS